MFLKRLSLIAGLLAIFAVCFYWMNQSYDPLARYPYADEVDREVLLKYLDQEDINYLISQQIRPGRNHAHLSNRRILRSPTRDGMRWP